MRDKYLTNISEKYKTNVSSEKYETNISSEKYETNISSEKYKTQEHLCELVWVWEGEREGGRREGVNI